MATTKLDQLTRKREELNAQIQALKAKENQKRRKEDTKRKILIGGVVMKMLKSGEMRLDRVRE
jgi:large subunit ribosomal protein L7/L12